MSASFSLGDAQSLPFEDATFDCAVSVFGLIFAPDGTVGFAADSPEAFLSEQTAEHPTALWAQAVLAQHGVDPGPLRERAVAALHEHNEDPAAFRATSRYHVIELTRLRARAGAARRWSGPWPGRD